MLPVPGSLVLHPDMRCHRGSILLSIAIFGGLAFFLSACLSMTVSIACFYSVLITTLLCHMMGQAGVRVAASSTPLYMSIALSIMLNCFLVSLDRVDEPETYTAAVMMAFVFTVVVHAGILHVHNLYARGRAYVHVSIPHAVSTADVVAGILAKVPAVHLKEQLSEELPASASMCVICLEDVAEPPADCGRGARGSGVLALPCRHAFHYGCLAGWMHHDRSRCPTCRAPVGPPTRWRLLLPSAEGARAGGEQCPGGDVEAGLHV